MNTVRIKPMLFNTEMVRAILEGRKTQTRRVVKGIEGLNPYRVEPAEDAYETLGEWDFMFGYALPKGGLVESFQVVKAPCAVGDILWVRETWAHGYIEHSDAEGSRESWFESSSIGCGGYIGALSQFFYRADDEKNFGEVGIKWCPSIHMPKKAARIFLKVTNIRAERLKEISNIEAVAEGVPLDYPMSPVYCPKCKGEGLIGAYHPDTLGGMDIACSDCADPVARFSNLWDSTVTDFLQFGWRYNPWVWVIEFERCEKPEGRCE